MTNSSEILKQDTACKLELQGTLRIIDDIIDTILCRLCWVLVAAVVVATPSQVLMAR